MCDKTDCMYHSTNPEWGCDFSDITGKCRLQPAATCTFYKKGKRPEKTITIGRDERPLTFGTRIGKYDWVLARKLWEQGMCDPQIAEKLSEAKQEELKQQLGVSVLPPKTIENNTCVTNTVFNWRKKNRLKANQFIPPAESMQETLEALYRECSCDREIAERAGLSKNTIFHWREAHRLPPKGKPFPAALHDWDKVLSLLNQGETMESISCKLDIPITDIKSWVAKRKIYVNKEVQTND